MNFHRQYIKSYKKNTIAILFSISLTITLVVSLLVVRASNNKIEVLQCQYTEGAQDFTIKNLNKEQVSLLQQDKTITHCALSNELYYGLNDRNQWFMIVSSNKDYILRTSKLLEGRIPTNENEVVAEKWVLDNLGIPPKINSEFTLHTTSSMKDNTSDSNFIKKKYKLVGIVTNNARNKTNSILQLYVNFDKSNYSGADADIKLKNGVNIKNEINRLKTSLNLTQKQINYNPYVIEKIATSFSFDKNEFLLIFSILIVCYIVISGVYRISIIKRSNQYGILKSLGMKNLQIFKLIFYELLYIYFLSIPIGITSGILTAYIINLLSQDNTLKLIFWGNEISLPLQIPYIKLILCILGIGIIIGILSLQASIRINSKSIITIISRNIFETNSTFQFLSIGKKNKFLKPYRKIAINYVFHNIKTTLSIILTICICSCLFIGLFYQSNINKIINENEKKMHFLNSDFVLEEVNDDIVTTGISDDILKKIKKIDGVIDIKTQMVMPIKVIDDIEKNGNKKYFDFVNSNLPDDTYFGSYSGNDGIDNYYLSSLRGFNKSALKKLSSYIVEGNINNLSGNNAIIMMPMTINKNDWRRSQGYFKNGFYVMNYKVGNKITMKYLSNQDTGSKKYWNNKYEKNDYTYMNFKISAIIYYPFLDCLSPTSQATPHIIISESQFKELFDTHVYSTINIDVDKSLNVNSINNIEDQLTKLSIENQNTINKSLINEKNSLDNLCNKELIYSYGICIVVLILSLLNIINNLIYRIQSRKQDISIFRAIGMNDTILSNMINFENFILGLISGILNCLLCIPVTRFLYKKSDLSYFNVIYKNNYFILILINITILIICYIVSKILTKELCNDNITKSINDIE